MSTSESSASAKKRPASTPPVVELKKPKPEERDVFDIKTDPTVSAAFATARTFSGTELAKLKLVDEPQSQFLVMMTSNAKKSAENSAEKGNNFSIINFVVLKALKSGFSSTPYEPRDTPVNQRVYTDKEGKAIDKPVQLNTLQTVDTGSDADVVSVFKSYHSHPKPSLKTKARGKATDVVGCIYPGTPMNAFIFDDQKVSVMESDKTEEELQMFSLAIVSMRMRSVDQCEKGFGIVIKQIRALPLISPAISGLFKNTYPYTDQQPINMQTDALLAKKAFAANGHNDLDFVKQSIRRNDSGDVTEKPVVVVDLNKAVHAVHAHTIDVGTDSRLSLKFNASGSIYTGMRFTVHVHAGVFTKGTSILWIRDYYQWCLDARVAKIVVMHDPYWVKRALEKEGGSAGECMIIVDEGLLFEQKAAHMSVPWPIYDKLKIPSEQLAVPIDLSEMAVVDGNTVLRYSGWRVCDSKTHFCVMDTSKLRKAKGTPQQGRVSDDKNSSLVCQIFPGMSSDRQIWLAYMCETKGDNLVAVIPVGVQQAVQSTADELLELPANVNLYADPLMLLE